MADYGHEIEFGYFLIAPPDPATLRTFIEDVAPQVRDRVATARVGAAPHYP